MYEDVKSLAELPDVSFIDNLEIQQLQTRMVADYEAEYKRQTGKSVTLAPADPMRVALYAAALQLYQGFQAADRSGKLNLLKYSYGSFLDNIAALRGVVRLPAQAAITEVRFTLSKPSASVSIIPKGTRVTSGYDLYFATTEAGEIPAGQLSIDLPCECTLVGEAGNGYLPGQLNTLVDILPYVESVSNISVSSGGSDVEDDASLAERVFLAPSGFSTAGPLYAYIYWVKSYSQAISDAQITSPEPGIVDIRVLLENGEMPDETFCEALAKFLQESEIRPLTDYVQVSAPDTVFYELNVSYYINRSSSARAEAIKSQVEKAVADFVIWQGQKIGRDINPSELHKAIVAAGAKRAEIQTPVFTRVEETSVAFCNLQTVTYGGIEDD